jgi:hypothetical protein
MTTPPPADLIPTLRAAFDRGPAGAPELDRLLGPAAPAADLRALLSLAEPDRLRLLRDRLYDGDVITHCFRRGAGRRTQGCVAYWLTGVTSVAELLARDYPTVEHLKAVCRSVRSWDDGGLTPDMVFEGLEAAIWDTVHDADPLDARLHEPALAR